MRKTVTWDPAILACNWVPLSPRLCPGELSATLIFALAAIKDGAPTRFFHQVQITLCRWTLIPNCIKCVNVQHVHNWCRQLKDECTDIHDELRSGRPSVLGETMLKDPVRKLYEMILDESARSALTDHLGYAKVCAKWVPRMLMEYHKP